MLRCVIETADAANERRAIGQVKVVNTPQERRLDNTVGTLAVNLERAARVDEDIGSQCIEGPANVAIAIDSGGFEATLGRQRSTELIRLVA